MRRLRLAIFGESPCRLCWARCCKQNGHEYAVLLEGEERRKFAAFSVDIVVEQEQGGVVDRVAERVIPYRDGQCPFLGDDDLCTIYEDRPANCRRFQCVPGYNSRGIGKHSEFLMRNRDVREMLDRL